MKALKFFTLLYILTIFSLYSQTVVWETETQDTISPISFDSLNSVYYNYSFITDDNQLVLVGCIEAGNLQSPYFSRKLPFFRLFNTLTGEEDKKNIFGISHQCIKVTMDTSYSFIGDSLDTASIYDEKNWIMEIDTTLDTFDVTFQQPIKTIKVGKEYWFICGSFFYGGVMYGIPQAYLVKMDEKFNIIEKNDKTNSYNQNSIISNHKSIFYDENKKCFISFPPMYNSLVIQLFDSNFNMIDQKNEEYFDFENIVPGSYSESFPPKLHTTRLDNGNYVIWYYRGFTTPNKFYSYGFVLHRLYDSELNLIKEQRRIRDQEIGYIDSGILKEPKSIINNSNTGGYFICAEYYKTSMLLEEYDSNGDSLRKIIFDISSIFPDCYALNQVLYQDHRFTYIGLGKEMVSDSSKRNYLYKYTVYLVETDDNGNIIWQYKVPYIYTACTTENPEVILGKEANTYYISGINRTQNLYDKNEADYCNFITMKIENNSSISEDNQFPELMIAPNPAASTFKVDYTLEKSGLLSITITDLLGNQVSEEYNNYVEAGTFTKTINIEDLLPGVYYINILHNGKITVKKIIKN